MLEGGKSVNAYGAGSHPRAGRQVVLPVLPAVLALVAAGGKLPARSASRPTKSRSVATTRSLQVKEEPLPARAGRGCLAGFLQLEFSP
jgi:hypothetical protein